MNGRQFAKYLARDLRCVCGCVGKEDTLIPQHRVNRGHGGSKLLDRPANILVMCSEMNGLIESDAKVAALARGYGWKLRSWQTPEEEPFFDIPTGEWILLTDDYNRTTTTTKAA